MHAPKDVIPLVTSVSIGGKTIQITLETVGDGEHSETMLNVLKARMCGGNLGFVAKGVITFKSDFLLNIQVNESSSTFQYQQ
jgi:hypothetical protein